jgi:hypothetical protein
VEQEIITFPEHAGSATFFSLVLLNL